jgi:SAM-dependent methyltransferase
MTDDATWAADSGPEAGVPHAYFDEKAARQLLSGWNVVALEERSAAETAGRWTHSAAETATMVHWFARLERLSNSGQIEYWNTEAGSRWVAFQERIDTAFAQVTAAALDDAKPQPDEAVLDVGCGCGTTVLELLRRVGPRGRVEGIDVSKPMLEAAAERARAQRATNVKLVLADAATHEFDEGAFDLVFSRFGVMFFDDPAGAFANIRRSLRAGARLRCVCWRELAANPWFRVPMTAAKPHLPPQPQPDPEAPGPLAFADADRVRRILEEAGFTNIELKRHDATIKMAGPHGLESAADFAVQLGPVARALAGADASLHATVRAAVLDALREHETAEGVYLGASVWFVSAQA